MSVFSNDVREEFRTRSISVRTWSWKEVEVEIRWGDGSTMHTLIRVRVAASN